MACRFNQQAFSSVGPERILQRASEALQIDLGRVFKSRRVSPNELDQRDFLIYLLWESGRFVNQQIGSLLGISYSNVSRRISEMRRRIDKERGLESKYQALKAQIKV